MAVAAPAVNDVWEVRLYSSANNQVAVNRLHFQCISVQDLSSTLNDIASSFGHLMLPDYYNLLSEFSLYYGLALRRVYEPLVRTQTVIYPLVWTGGPGGVAGDLIPGQVAGLITLKTDRAGRGSNGRLFIPWMSEDSNNDSGVVDPVFVAQMQTFGEKIVGTNALTTTIGGKPTITVQSGVFNRAAGLFRPFTAVRARAFWATHKSRSFINRGDALPT